MKSGRFLAALLLAAPALLLAGCGEESGGNNAAGPPLDRIAPPAGSQWTDAVAETPEGGYRMGNPNAPVKLVEYGSLGCHVCADFSKEGGEPLREKYVKTGQVSWEFRPYLLFPSDPGVSMLLRCRGPAPFFQLSDQLYADQASWMGRLQSMPAETQRGLQAMTPLQRSAVLVQATGVDQFFRVRGMPQAQIDACLADGQALQDLAVRTQRANEEGVAGTPTFFINGRKIENAASWATLEPALRAALGR